MALSPETQTKVNKLGSNQKSILDSLANRPYPGGGWVWSNHSETIRLCESLVKRGLVTRREVRGVTPSRSYDVYEAIPEITADLREREAARSAVVMERHREETAARERVAKEQSAHQAAVTALIEEHADEFLALLGKFRAEYGVAQSV